MSTYPHPQILPWLHIDLQRVKLRSITLTIAFSEQMCQVANTGNRIVVRNFILRVHNFIVSVRNFILRVHNFILHEQNHVDAELSCPPLWN